MPCGESPSCLPQSNLKSQQTFKAYIDAHFLERRRSSDIDLLRTSVLESIDKNGHTYKSAECLLNDYGDMQPLDPRKKQRSFDLLDMNSETFDVIDSKDQKANRGHSRSKSTSLKKTVVQQCKDQLKRYKSKSSTNLAEGESVLQIAITQYANDNTPTKPHTLPRNIHVSKLEGNLDLLTGPPSLMLQERTSRRRKLEKISSMLSLKNGDKKEFIRYELIFNQLHWCC